MKEEFIMGTSAYTTELDTPELGLDDTSIEAESLSLPALMRELNLQRRPPWILAALMGVLERKRQAQGMGWSRPWNKVGMTIFRTHQHEGFDDAEYFRPIELFLESIWSSIPAGYAAFGRALVADPSRMAFTFHHVRTAETGRQYEGLTISLGRRVKSDRSKRDRLDIVLEDERVNGTVDRQVDLVRVYVCPWAKYSMDREFHLWEAAQVPTEEVAEVQALYGACVGKYHEWKNEPARQWDHWAARSMDYFGPRPFIPRNSAFT